MYHDGNRSLQAQFGSTALADRLLKVTHHTSLNDHDIAFVQAAAFFFLATADADGRPDCSFKGGAPGFVQVVTPGQILFPDYDGNGMFKSLGNIKANAHVGLLFMTMDDSPRRLRINGRASLVEDEHELEKIPGAQLLVKVDIDHIFPNCPRYIPDMENGQASKDIPSKGKAVEEPEWKSYEVFSDVVPPRKN